MVNSDLYSLLSALSCPTLAQLAILSVGCAAIILAFLPSSNLHNGRQSISFQGGALMGQNLTKTEFFTGFHTLDSGPNSNQCL